MTFNTLNDPSFTQLKSMILAYPRGSGHYLTDLISIRELREQGMSEEQLCDLVFQHFDDRPWPPKEERRSDGTWAEYRANAELAESELIYSLIGPYEQTMPKVIASAVWQQFDSLFEQPKTYYVRMGLGKQEMVFSLGVAILSASRAGLVFVIEND